MSKITYHKEGEIYIPDLYIKNNRRVNLGKYGLLRLDYLKNYKKAIYMSMKITGTLQSHLEEIDKKGMQLEIEIVKSIAEKEKINEELKARDQLKWIELMNATRNQAEEIILYELIWKD